MKMSYDSINTINDHNDNTNNESKTLTSHGETFGYFSSSKLIDYQQDSRVELTSEEPLSLTKREIIKENLLMLANNILLDWDSYDTIIDMPDIQYVAKVTTVDQIPVTVIKWHCEGLTEAQWDKYKQDPTVIATAVNPKMTRIALPDDEGYEIRLMKL